MRILNDAIQATYLYRKGYLNTLSRERRNALIGENLLYRIKIILNNTLKEFLTIFKKQPFINLEGRNLALINSRNNQIALEFLKDEVTFIKFSVNGNKLENVYYYQLKLKFFYSLLFLMLLPIILFDKKNQESLILLHKAFGIQTIFKNILKEHGPNKLIFTNDHTPEMRSFVLAAKEMGIKTVYIQHGSVSSYFPPLIFDLALLESQYSLDTYKKIGISNKTHCELIGMPKLDEAIKKIKERDFIKTIGLAINQNDEESKINAVINALINKYKIIIRKHPLDFRKFDFQNNAAVQNGNNGDVLEFIQEIDFLIASDSSIHVEANSLKCRSIYFMLHSNRNKYDYYGFVKNKFIDEIHNTDQLINYIKNFDYKKFDFVSEKMKYYNGALDYEKYGNSCQMAMDLVMLKK